MSMFFDSLLSCVDLLDVWVYNTRGLLSGGHAVLAEALLVMLVSANSM